MKVYSPVSDFTGKVAGVEFVAGKGDASEASEAALSYFDRKGYRLSEDTESDPQETDDDRVDLAPPAKSASKAEWVEFARVYATDNDDVDSMTKDQLIEHFGG